VKLSKRGEYALRALIDFGLAQAMGRPLLQVNELASKEDLPVKFLEQILMQLKAAGYLESRRGKHGGYLLARRPEDIQIGQVVRLIDGPLAPIRCVSQVAYERCTCPDEEHCGLRMVMLDVRNAISNILDRFSLADVVEVTLRKMRRNNVPLPFAADSLPTTRSKSSDGGLVTPRANGERSKS
jgi:Rrf2 family protein